MPSTSDNQRTSDTVMVSGHPLVLLQRLADSLTRLNRYIPVLR